MKLWRGFKKRFGIPNKPRALPSRFMKSPDDTYTWEDWEKDSKAKYPLRYLLFETIPNWFGRVAYRIEMRWLDFKYLRIEKSHLLDMRGAPIHSVQTPYKGGWLSPSDIVEGAIYSSFKRYIKLLDDRYGGLDSCIQKSKEWYDSAKSKEEKSAAGVQVEFYNRIRELEDFFENKLPALMKDLSNEGWEANKILITEHLIEIVRLRHKMQP